MGVRETTIAKLQQLPDWLLQEVSDFIDGITRQHQSVASDNPQRNITKTWAKWFESVDHLDIVPPKPSSPYQQLLLNKYRKQGLEL
ncbi:hypothetical protein AB3R30_13130 [Leptolyngbyaceae cyanobacterium UHCC 1019]